MKVVVSSPKAGNLIFMPPPEILAKITSGNTPMSPKTRSAVDQCMKEEMETAFEMFMGIVNASVMANPLFLHVMTKELGKLASQMQVESRKLDIVKADPDAFAAWMTSIQKR